MRLAEDAGLYLDEWQQLVLNDALGEADDGKWAAFEVGLVVPRQNGKGGVLEARELAGLFLFGERFIIHSAHEFKTAKEAFYRMEPLIMGCPKLAKRVKQVRRSSEEVGFELKSGARLRYLARKGGTGRGFTGDCVILDEAFNLNAEVMGAVLPTLSARPNPQIWYTSSAPMATSSQLHAVRRRALAASSPRLSYAEWSRDPELGRDDPRAWAQANPALGIRITEDFIRSEIEALPEGEFNRERLGDPDPELGHGEPVWPQDTWHRCSSDEAAPTGRMYVGVAATPDRKRATIAVAGGGVVEVALNASLQRVPASFGDLAADVIRIARELDAMVFVAPDGPAGFIIPELEASYVPVTKVSPQAMGQACGQIYTAVNEGRFRVRRNPDLNAAVAGAVQRDKGDVWVWARRDVAVDVSPLEAVTLAWWGDVQASQFFGGSVASLSDFDT